MVENLDIHNKEKKLSEAVEFLKRGGIQTNNKTNAAPISRHNIDRILEHFKMRSLEQKSAGTRAKEIHTLINIARILNKDFETASKDDLKDVLLKIDSSGKYAAWTRSKYRLLIRLFYKWLKYGDEYLSKDGFPEEVAWIKNSFKKKDEKQIEAKELITEEQMKKMIDAAEHPRDKAFISILTESGARIAEIGNLRIKDVYQDEFSYLIHIKGKTGERTDRVFYSDSYIALWLNIHPFKNNPEAPLWINFRNHGQMKYHSLLRMIERVCKSAGLENCRHNPHFFRHSRVTINSRKGMSEPLLKKYFGWEADSKMMARYSHLVSDDANDAILKMYGVKVEKKQDELLKPNICEVCHNSNSPTDNFCSRCARPLNHETALAYRQYQHEASKILNKLCENQKFLEMLKTFMAENTVAEQ